MLFAAIKLALHQPKNAFRQYHSMTLEWTSEGIVFKWHYDVPYSADAPPEQETTKGWLLTITDENSLGERLMSVIWDKGWKPQALVILVDEFEHTQEVAYADIIEVVIQRIQKAESELA